MRTRAVLTTFVLILLGCVALAVLIATAPGGPAGGPDGAAPPDFWDSTLFVPVVAVLLLAVVAAGWVRPRGSWMWGPAALLPFLLWQAYTGITYDESGLWVAGMGCLAFLAAPACLIGVGSAALRRRLGRPATG